MKVQSQYRTKRTEEFRQKEDGSDEPRLFLSLVKPHKPVSKQTIANWIVQTIKMAYDGNINVNAHSTRAIGPSWALFKGSTMKTIMEAADWSNESTFTKFYLRNVDMNIFV